MGDITVIFTNAQVRVLIGALNLYTAHTPEDDVGITADDLRVAERAWSRINQAIKDATPAPAPPQPIMVTEKPKEGSIVRDGRRHYWRVNRTRCINLTPDEEMRPDEYGWAHWHVFMNLYGAAELIRDGKENWVGYFPPHLRVW